MYREINRKFCAVPGGICRCSRDCRPCSPAELLQTSQLQPLQPVPEQRAVRADSVRDKRGES